MIVEPDPGQSVYSRRFEMCGVVDRVDSGWWVVDHGDGLSASKPDDLVVPTAHAGTRWRQRVAGRESRAEDYDPGEHVASAWARSVRLGGHGLDADEARADPETGVVLLLKENAVVTIMGERDRAARLDRAVAEAL
jgi:hypothetical protein